jgi:TusA-related sulfurtransferase
VNLDCTGQRCPKPVIELARIAKTASPGTVVHITTDDPAAVVDIPAWCRMRRHGCSVIADVAGAVTHAVVFGAGS